MKIGEGLSSRRYQSRCKVTRYIVTAHAVRRSKRTRLRLYAQTMAERGFLTLAFDPSYTGESGGEPRNAASPDINTEDFSAAVDFLAARPNVDAERIGIIGICGNLWRAVPLQWTRASRQSLPRCTT